MTFTEIYHRIEMIRSIMNDFESAHFEEDRLAWDFISYIATTYSMHQDKAKLLMVLKTFDFPRHCA